MRGKIKFFLIFTGVLLILSLAINVYLAKQKGVGAFFRKNASLKKEKKVVTLPQKVKDERKNKEIQPEPQPASLSSSNELLADLPDPDEKKKNTSYTPRLKATPLLFSRTNAVHNNHERSIEVTFTGSSYIRNVGKYTITPHVPGVTVSKSWNSITFYGKFQGGTLYRISGLKGTSNRDGMTLSENITCQVKFPFRAPDVDFVLENGFFPLKGKNFSLPYSAVNAERLFVEVKKHHNNNLHLAQGSSSIASNYHSGDEYLVPVSKKSFTLPLLPRDKVFFHNLELKDLIPEKTPGVYLVKLYGNGPERQGGDRIYISITDLALQVIRDDRSGKTAIWVRSISGAELPPGGVTLQVLSRKNQIVAKGITDKEGKLLLTDDPFWKKEYDAVTGVMASAGKDVAYFQLSDGRKGGEKFSPLPAGKDLYAFLFTERGVVRPGEKISFFSFLRKEKKGMFLPQKGIYLEVRLQDPKRNVISSANIAAGDEGVLQGDFRIPETAPHGFWTIDLALPGEKKIIASRRFQVASFVPDRLKVKAKLLKKVTSTAEKIPFEMKAEYYFGAPLSGGKASLAIAAQTGKNPSFWNSSWTAGAKDLYHAPDFYSAKALCGKDGKATFTYPGFHQQGGKAYAPIAVTASLTATEPGGGSVSENLSATLHPTPFYIGVRKGKIFRNTVSFEYTLLGAEKLQKITLKHPLAIQFKLEQEEWERVLKKDYNGFQYQWVKKMIPCSGKELLLTIPAGTLPAGKVFTTKPVALPSGSYLMHLTAALPDGRECRTLFPFYHFAGESSKRSSHLYALNVTSDREKVLPGEEFHFSFTSSIPGELFLTYGSKSLEGTRVYPVKAGKNSFAFRIPTNVTSSSYYLGCTLITGKKLIPDRRFGLLPVKVDQKQHKLDLALTLPKRALPGAKITLTLESKDVKGLPRSGKAVLYAVDSGILSLTNYKVPDIFQYFFGAFSSPMTFYDMYSDFREDLRLTSDGQIAGDSADAFSGGKRINLRQKKSAILILPSVTIPSDGKVRMPVTLPKHTGELTFFAVASSGEKAGSTSGKLILREDVTLTLSAPRAMAPGDEGGLTATFFNHTARKIPLSCRLTLPEGMELLKGSPGKQENFLMPKNGGVGHFFRIRPGKGCKGGVIKLQYTFEGRTLEEEHYITVRSPNPPEKRSYLSILEKGESLTVTGAKEFEGTPHITLRISGNPASSLKQGLAFLESYPYGCLEQVTAGAFPYLVLPDLVKLGLMDEALARTHSHKILSTRARILSMQLSNGSFSMWQGGSESWVDASIFALHFLAAAGKEFKEAELPGNSLRFLRDLVSGKCERDSRARRAYASYVLALAGDPSFLAGARNVIAGSKKADFALFLAGCALVKGGYASLGVPSIGDALSAGCWKEENVPFSCSDEVCRKGLILYMLEKNALSGRKEYQKYAGKLAMELASAIRKDGSGWGTTQSNAWAVLGLGAYAARVGNKDVSFLFHSADGKKSSFQRALPLELTGSNGVKITNTSSLPLIAEILMTGTPRILSKKQGKISLKKEYLNSKGKAVTEAAHGEKLFVRLTVSSESPLENVVISDLLPGGLAIEDERLASRSAAIPAHLANTYKGIYPKRLEKGDDRFLFFGDLPGKGKKGVFTYQVRAVSKGKFKIPPLHGEAMYDLSAKGYHITEGIFTVK